MRNTIVIALGALSLSKATATPTVKPSSPSNKQVYLFDINVAGTSYVDNIKEIEPYLEKGSRINCFREEKNEQDPLAIVLKDEKGNKLGYIPRTKNEILAQLMDTGKTIYGTLCKKEYVNFWLKIELHIYLDD